MENSLILISLQAVQWKPKWKRVSRSVDSVQFLQFCNRIVPMGQEPGPDLAGPLPVVSKDCSQGVHQAVFSCRSSTEEVYASNVTPTSEVTKATYGWTSFYWAVFRPLASCWLWALGWRPSLGSWRWPSVPQGHLQFLYHIGFPKMAARP